MAGVAAGRGPVQVLHTDLMVFILQLGLCALGARANSLGVITVESATWLSVEQLGAIFIVSGDEQGDAERSTHDSLLAVGTLAKAQGKITDGLRAALDAERLVVVEVVGLALDTGVFNHRTSVRLEARHGAAQVAIDLDNLLNGGGLEEGRGHALLDAEDDTFGGGDANGGGAELDGFKRVFDLEQAAFGGKGIDPPI